MFSYFIKRVLYAIPIALAVTMLCFSLVYLAPGDPLQAVLPADASQEVIDSVKAEYGLDKPLPAQYLMWLERALKGDLGKSIGSGRAVTEEIGKAIGNSLLLAVLAATLAFTVGSLMGIAAGYRQGSAYDRALSSVAIAGVSIPHYWLGIVLVAIFSAKLNWLPSIGSGVEGDGHWSMAQVHYLILPVLTLSAMPAGIVMRSVRALVADTLNKDFVTGLVAKGMGKGAIFRHLAKNIAPTTLAVFGVQLGYLMAGSILVETVFAWPGTGLLLSTAILQRDIPLLQGTIFVLSLLFVGLNLVVDLLQPFFDPRMKRS
ncbi:ABC transporter permease [Herbaspirillum sp.]|uniref:ABC transporter permease n=1 Tax=Herbaspirillum sp. TaxID=1890675 RepID=UPI001B296031|nr:ABC transporter permease [Herbaspirillum sp.]MBO9535349.1 ABC transporter permease [Herbaspirillum sp.]